MYSRTNINHKREYYLPASSTTSRGKTITNARAKKIFILRLRIDRLFKWIVCRSKMIWVNILLLFKCGFNNLKYNNYGKIYIFTWNMIALDGASSNCFEDLWFSIRITELIYHELYFKIDDDGRILTGCNYLECAIAS